MKIGSHYVGHIVNIFSLHVSGAECVNLSPLKEYRKLSGGGDYIQNARVTPREFQTLPLKADSHIACRAHAVPLPCRAAKGLECVFPI